MANLFRSTALENHNREVAPQDTQGEDESPILLPKKLQFSQDAVHIERGYDITDSQENTINVAATDNTTRAHHTTIMGTKMQFGIQPNASLQVQNKDDLKQLDQNLRTLLHRAAFQQKYELVAQLRKKAEQEELDTDFLNKRDLYGNTPLNLCCMLKQSTKTDDRFHTIEALVNEVPVSKTPVSEVQVSESLASKKAEVNTQSDNTLWTPLTWCAYYGDKKSVSLLLNKEAKPYLPDNKGYFPIDWAGKTKNKDVVELLVDKLIDIIEEFDKRSEEFEDLKAIYGEDGKFIKTPLLRNSVFYWSCFYNLDMKKVRRIMGFSELVLEVPLYNKDKRTVIHACCCNNNYEALKEILDSIVSSQTQNKSYNRSTLTKSNSGVIKNLFALKKLSTAVLPFSQHEKKFYKPNFHKQIDKLSRWTSRYYTQILRDTKIDPDKRVKFFDSMDWYGNTPLHIATFRGNYECAKLLLEHGANIEAQNNQGWRCIELTRFENISTLFKTHLKELKEKKAETTEVKLPLFAFLLDTTKTNVVVPELRKPELIEDKKANEDKISMQKLVSKFDLKFEEQKMSKIVPDLVIVFKIPKNKEREQFLMDRMNFHIGVLTETTFNVYLVQGINKGTFMILLTMSESDLEIECDQLGMKMKLLESFQQEVFDISRRCEFEPFRSLERQEIALKSVKKFVDLDVLKENEVIVEYFKMHTMAGRWKINETWITKPKWYWPEPLCSLKEYTVENPKHNYFAITLLKQYFGDKISFFFAFTSFLTCYLFYLAVPGIAVHSFIFWRRYRGGESDDTMYDHPIVLAWVIYVVIWNVCTVERWKRKNAEIAIRWGISTQGSITELSFTRIRRQFFGYECISHNIGALTKKNKFPVTNITFIASLPVLVILLGAVVATFYGTTTIKSYGKSYEDGAYSTEFQIVAGVINGVSIFILNSIYMLIARWFVKKENHKYQEYYERSLILKSFVFRFLNSFIGVFYIAYIQVDSEGKQTSLEDIFILLVTLVLTKQVTSVTTLTLIPFFIYKYNQIRYFRQARQRFRKQNIPKDDADPQHSLQDLSSRENIDRVHKSHSSSKGSWLKNLISGKKKDDFSFRRPVLDCKNEFKPEEILNEWEVSQIELNAVRSSFKDLVDSYGEMFVLLSFITLFAAAFPYGPAIALFLIIIDIRSRLFALLNVYERPPADTYNGIGYWLVVWEAISICSVFTNLVLLYRQLDFDWTDASVFGEHGDYAKLFIFIIAEHIILILKFFLAEIIPDEPQWVTKYKQREDYMEDLEIRKLRVSDKKDIFRRHEKKQTRILENPKLKNFFGVTADHLSKWNQESLTKTDLNQAIKLVLYDTYATIERELLISRMSDVSDLNSDNLLVRCTICFSKKAVIECKTSHEFVCRKCYFTVESKLNSPERQIDLVPMQRDLLVGLQEEVDKIKKRNSKANNGADTSRISTSSNWRKFEFYTYPTHAQSEHYSLLSEAFKMLSQIYIASNGISATNAVLDENKFLRLTKQTASPTKDEKVEPNQKSSANGASVVMTPAEKSAFKTELSQDAFDRYFKFIQLKNFNTEEKIFMNKAAFLVFKRSGAKAKFQEFFRIIKSLQEGTFENKVYMLFDLLDENDDGLITPEDLLRVVRGSYIQSSHQLEDVRQTVLSLFQDTHTSNKKQVFSKILTTPAIKSLLMCLLQVHV